jgi:uncharacterized protein
MKCANCSNPLKQLNSALVFAHLTKPERVANKFGSVQFLGWQCPNCQPQLTGSGIHIRAYTSGAGKFRECPTCRELTMVRTTSRDANRTNNRNGGETPHQFSLLLLFLRSGERATDFALVSLQKELCKLGFQ